jgi:hypothetical protein
VEICVPQVVTSQSSLHVCQASSSSQIHDYRKRFSARRSYGFCLCNNEGSDCHSSSASSKTWHQARHEGVLHRAWERHHFSASHEGVRSKCVRHAQDHDFGDRRVATRTKEGPRTIEDPLSDSLLYTDPLCQ